LATDVISKYPQLFSTALIQTCSI